MMPKASKEAMESHVFEIDNLCVNAEIAGMEDEGQPLEIFISVMEDARKHVDALLITCDEKMELLEEIPWFSKEIANFLEYSITDIEDGGDGKGAATVDETNSQDQRQLDAVRLFTEAKEDFQPPRDEKG